MKILIVSQYFWPEFFPINKLSTKLCDLGHEITVVTGKPNYPEGIIHDGYTSSGVINESYGAVEVIRLPLRPRYEGALNLMLNYLSFVVSGIKYISSVLKERDFDVIFVYAPSPITTAIPAIWCNRKLRTHLSIWVQDIWPQSLEATGYVKNRFILNRVKNLVKWIYKKADTLLVPSHSFQIGLEEIADTHKIIYYPNSIEDPASSAPKNKLPEDIRKIFESGFNIVFAGNIGKAQSIPTLLQAAFELQDTDCRFVFVGNGSMLDWAKNKSLELGLSNTVFIGRIENDLMSSIYELSDALLLSLTGKEIFSYTIPGKLQAYLAAGKPVVASVNGEAGTVIKQAAAGVVFPAEDSKSLARGIREFRALSQSVRDEMGVSGRQYFKQHFDVDIMATKLIEIFEARAGIVH